MDEITSTETPIEDLPVDPDTPLFRIRAFALLFTTRLASNTANQMQAIAIGWQVYDLTNSALNLGLIGLVQFMPPLLLMLLAGTVADRYNRRLILRCCYVIEFCMSDRAPARDLAAASERAGDLWTLVRQCLRADIRESLRAVAAADHGAARPAVARDRGACFCRPDVGSARPVARRHILWFRCADPLRHLCHAGDGRRGRELPVA